MFRRLSVPTPFAIGPVNAYLGGRTLVDPGPDSDETWSALLAGLEDDGLGPGDVEQVLVTHPHPDHFGLAARLRDAGADVLASPGAAAIIGDFRGRLEDEQDYFVDFFQRCGLSRSTAVSVTQLPDAFLAYAPDVETDRELTAGDLVSVDDAAVGVETAAGHAVGELVFTVAAGGQERAIVGDQVLPDITPNPLLQPPREPGGERPLVLPAYNRSLEALAAADYDRILPGHGEVIEHPAERIDAILAANESRTAAVYDLVDGPTTPAEIMEGIFGDLPATEKFPGMSEAVGHLDVLEERGRVTHREEGGLRVYERVDDR